MANKRSPVSRHVSPVSRHVSPILLRYQDYLNIHPEHKGRYFSKPKTPSTSPSSSPNSPSSNNKLQPTIGGINLKRQTSLTPLISALLLAGIKLALEEKKRTNGCKAAKAAKTSKANSAKAANTVRRRKTI